VFGRQQQKTHLVQQMGSQGEKRSRQYFANKGCHIVALPFTLKSILSQKKNYENSNISPCKNIIFKKIR
jgi:hypothetical protein